MGAHKVARSNQPTYFRGADFGLAWARDVEVDLVFGLAVASAAAGACPTAATGRPAAARARSLRSLAMMLIASTRIEKPMAE